MAILSAEVDRTSVLDFDSLEARVHLERAHYAAAEPFKHIVLDDFFEREAALCAATAFPPFARTALARAFGARVYGGKLPEAVPELRRLVDVLHTERFTRYLEALTGIRDLAPDVGLVGSGIHQGARGSDLHVHADHNTHPDDPTWYRRINVLVYLNPNWERAWDGDLQLWDAHAGRCVKRVPPLFNRCVIMEVHDRAFHGYDRLRIPEGETRQSIATYFYTHEPGLSQAARPHGTLFPRLTGGAAGERLSRAVRRKILHRIEKAARALASLRRP